MSGRRLALAAAAVAIASLVFHMTYAFDGIALFDEGLLADGTMRVLQHERIGRDAFVPYGPASYWVLAPVFHLFGATMGVLRAATATVQALCDGALFVAASTGATPLGALLAAAVLVVAHGSLHKSFLVVAAVLVLLAARASVRRVDGRGAFVAGVLCGTAFLFRHDAGAFGAFALLIGSLCEASPARTPWPRRFAGLAAGFLVPVLPAVFVLVAQGLDPRSWWDHEWQRIAAQERIRVAFPWPVGPDGFRWGRAALAGALLFAPALHIGWGGLACLRRVSGRALEHDALRIATALFGLLLLNQARLVPSVNHLFQASAPVALALGDALARRGRGRGATVAGTTTLAALVAGLAAWCARMPEGPYSGSFAQRVEGAVLLRLPTGGVRVAPQEAATIERLVARIQERIPAGGFLATSPSCPLLAFLAQRRLAIPYAEPGYYFGGTRFQQEAVDAIEARRPALFIHDPRPASTFTLERDAPILAAYFASHYRPVETIDRFVVCERWR
jgi:hypothetical protein